MNLEKYCPKCHKEIVREGDVVTMYEGKEFCKCDICPECGNKYLVHQEGCVHCDICGWSACL